MNKIEGWDCGSSSHLHKTEAEAQYCLDMRQERKARRLEAQQVKDAGWRISDDGEYLIAVNIQTGASRWSPITANTIGGVSAQEAGFIKELLNG